MRYIRTLFLISLLLVTIALYANAAQRVTCYTTWDDYFFYAAFEVPDTDIRSTNLEHMSKPWEDDSIEVFLETDANRASDRTPHTYQMSVSSGGGSSWLIGENGKAAPKRIFAFKYSTQVQGTLNKPEDRDIGYVVELAMPWDEMGGAPKPGTTMGFNFICNRKGDDDGFTSFSREVKTADDIQVPAKWAKIRFVDNPTVIALDNGTIISRKVFSRGPVVDGKFSPNEWNRDLCLTMALPEPVQTVQQQQQVKQSLGIEKLILAKYYYWYSADGEKSGAVHGPGTYADHPFDGLGPWIAYNSVQWHKDQLSAMAANGIDVVLPVYSADPSIRGQYGSEGLNAMVQAMKELKAEDKSAPLAGMYLDVDSIVSRIGKGDVSVYGVNETAYGSIRDFFLHIPAEFRTEIQIPAEKGTGAACIVALSSSATVKELNPQIVEYCNEQFAKDFGRRLIWIGDQQYKAKFSALDGYTSDASNPSTIYYDESGWIKVATISPVASVRQQRSELADGYKNDWQQVLSKSPDWILLDSWNNFVDATEVCPSKEYGYVYADATKLGSMAFNGMKPYGAKFLRHDTPIEMLPAALYQVTLTIKNAGLKPWYSTDGIFLAGRWYKDGALYADSASRLPIQGRELAGNIFSKTIGIRTIDQDGAPLPAGDYELRWEMMRGRDEWFADMGSMPLSVPVKIGMPATGFTVVSSDAPVYMKSGAEYKATIKVRNDGPTVWKAGQSASTDCRILKAYDLTIQNSPFASSVTPLTEDVEPGRIVEINLPVKFGSSDAVQSEPLYGMNWTVPDPGGSRDLAVRGSDFQPVRIVSEDRGCKYIANDIPAEARGGKRFPVNITIRNAGVDVWTKTSATLVYNWFCMDGSIAENLAGSIALPKDVKPGEEIALKANIPAPQYNGRYNLVWDVSNAGEQVISGTNISKGDLLIVPVKVTKGKNPAGK